MGYGKYPSHRKPFKPVVEWLFWTDPQTAQKGLIIYIKQLTFQGLFFQWQVDYKH